MILDTDIMIDFLKNDKGITKKIEELKEKEIKLSTTSINVMEILRGFFAFNKTEEKITEFINHLTVLDFNPSSARIAAEISDELKREGQTLDILDLMIAAIAIDNKETLWTNNVKHFNRIPRLNLE
jgi:tRNA(fMet)-specific endonuclease VapC